MKAGCGKTARPVWAADEGQRSGSRAFSDPTMKNPAAREAAGSWRDWRST